MASEDEPNPAEHPLFERMVFEGLLSSENALRLAETKMPMLFRHLNIDAMEHVLRNLATCPSGSDWRNYLHLDVLFMLLAPSSPILARVRGHFMRTIFLTTRSGMYYRGRNMFTGHSIMPDDAVVLSVTENLQLGTMFAIAALAAESVHDLILDELDDAPPVTFTYVYQAIAARADELHRIRISLKDDEVTGLQALQELMPLRAEQITHLELQFTACTSAFVADVFAEVQGCANVEKLTVKMTSSPGLNHVTEICTNVLRDLTLESDAPVTNEYLANIANMFGFIERIHINCSQDWDRTAYATMLVSRGTDLKYAYLGEMNAHLCRTVRAACPNAKFSVIGKSDLDARISALGPSLHKLSMELIPDPNLDKVVYSAINCVALEFLNLHLGGDEWSIAESNNIHTAATALFARPLTSLRELFLRGYRGERDPKGALLSSVAASCRNLETLFFLGDLHDMNRLDVFGGLPLLEVSIVSDGPKPFGKLILTLSEAFIPCNRLRNLRITADVDINNMPDENDLKQIRVCAEEVLAGPCRQRTALHVSLNPRA